ncbi:hypothetical protein JL722_4430 [Aureococcus anophagefferens]|nr:hypothetical protein JL722_4430 [Aureococcus anophagefferens]
MAEFDREFGKDPRQFNESDTRRVAETRELNEQTAVEWTRDQRESDLIVERGAVRCGKKGTVAIFECTPEYRDALSTVADGAKLAAASEPLAAVARRECAAGGCCVLRARVGGAGAAWRTLAFCEALGRGLPQVAGGDALPKRVARSAALGNDAPIPDAAIDYVVVACGRPGSKRVIQRRFNVSGRPAKSARALSLATCDALLRGASLEAKGTLRRPMTYACDPCDAAWRASGSAAPAGAAPCLDQDDDFRKTLRFSAALKANVEWCDDAAGDAIDALAELEAAGDAAKFPFDLKEDDVLVIDAARWLFSLDLPASNDGLVWFRGSWMPGAALAATARGRAVRPSSSRPGSRSEAEAAPAPAATAPPLPATNDDDDARWLANLVKAEMQN